MTKKARLACLLNLAVFQEVGSRKEHRVNRAFPVFVGCLCIVFVVLRVYMLLLSLSQFRYKKKSSLASAENGRLQVREDGV